MILMNIDTFRWIIPFKNNEIHHVFSDSDVWSKNYDCFVHYYIQQLNTSIA